MAVTSKIEMIFIFTGTRLLRPPSLLIDEPLLATATSGLFSDEIEVCWCLSTETLSRERSMEKRILRSILRGDV